MKKKRIEYWDSEKTKIKSEKWFNSKGEYSRVDGPSVQRWYRNGQKEYEIWYLYDKFHRVYGPAYLYWYENGQKSIESWYLDGKELSEREIVVLKRKRKLRSIK